MLEEKRDQYYFGFVNLLPPISKSPSIGRFADFELRQRVHSPEGKALSKWRALIFIVLTIVYVGTANLPSSKIWPEVEQRERRVRSFISPDGAEVPWPLKLKPGRHLGNVACVWILVLRTEWALAALVCRFQLFSTISIITPHGVVGVEVE